MECPRVLRLLLRTLLGVGFCLARGPALARAPTYASAPGADAIAVYQAFLAPRTSAVHATYVSELLAPPSTSTYRAFSVCLKGVKPEPPEAGEQDLRGTALASRPDVHLVEPVSWAAELSADAAGRAKAGRSAVPMTFMTLSQVLFDRKHTVALLVFSTSCNRPLCGGGGSLVFDRTAAGWKARGGACAAWMSWRDARRPRANRA